MALLDKAKELEAQKAAQEQNGAAPVPQTAPGKAAAAKGAMATFSQQGASIRAGMSEDAKQAEGTKSKTIAFVCALGDPLVKQSRTENNATVPSNKVVGYKFKALEPVDVPLAPLKNHWKDMLDVESKGTRHIEAGEIFALNLVETSLLISRIEYAGRFEGEDHTVCLFATSSKNRNELLPVLSLEGKGSIKEGMELIGEVTVNENGGRGIPKLKPEYAVNFGELFSKISTGGRQAVSSKKGESQANLAAAFRALYEKKGLI